MFTFILLIDKILQFTELIINKGVAIGSILELFLYLTPSLLVVTVPMSLLIAILFTFARFSSDSEIIAMKSCGISLYNMFPPIILFAFAMYIITSLLMVYALPYGNVKFKRKIYGIVQNRLDIGIKERVFNDDFKDIVIFVSEINKKSGGLKDVIVSDTRETKESHTIIAKRGELLSDKEKMEVVMILKDGTIHKMAGEEYHIINFNNYQFKLSMGKFAGSGKVAKSAREMTLAELKKMIRNIEESGGDSSNEKVEYHKKFSLPFACIVFGIIASPLGIFSRRAGKSKGFTLGMFVILIYYLLLIFGESVGKRGVLMPAVSMWIPNIVLGLAGVYIFIKSANESRIKLFDDINRLYDYALTYARKIFKRYF
jgi:lipopolysaccharide export system permease protein